MARVFVTRALPGDALRRLDAAGHELSVWAGSLPPEPERLRREAAGAHGVLTLLTDRVDTALLDAAPQLRVVSNYAVGCDNVDLPEAVRRGVQVGVTPDVLTEATADLAMALLLAAARRIPEAAADVRAGRWRTWEPAGWLGLELAGATLLVVGAGRIGRAVAHRAEAFGMTVRLARRGDDLSAVLPTADAVSLHVPLTGDTHHLVDERALRLLPGHAVLVNTARGPVVDPGALARALHAGWIAGAALDVTDPEPLPADHPLLRAPNLLVTPHIGSATRATRERMADLAVDNLLAGLAGRPLPHPAAAPGR